MTVIYVLLPVALIFAAAAVYVFFWAVRTGQFDDLETPAIRALHDDDPAANDAEAPPSGAPGEPPPDAPPDARSRS